MIEEFVPYYKDIGMTDVAIDRAKAMADKVFRFYPGKAAQTYVSDLVDGEGRRSYLNLWFFGDTFITEIKGFMVKDEFDFCAVGLVPFLADVSSTDYNFEKADEASRLTVKLSFSSKLTMQFNATKNNCDYLRALMQELFLTPDGLVEQ